MIRSLTVDNFRVLSGKRTFDFESGVTTIIGKNERGKSTLVNAIAWCLYGNASLPKKIAAADVVNDHAPSCTVILRFAFGGGEYELTRTQRRNGSGDAKLLRDGKPLATGRDPVAKEVAALFDVDEQGFMVSVFSRQDELDALAGQIGSARVTMMLRLMGVEQADKAIATIREDAREQKRHLDVLRAGVGDVAALEAEADGYRTMLATAKEQLVAAEAEQAEAEQAVATLREQQSQPAAEDAKLTQLKEDVATLREQYALSRAARDAAKDRAGAGSVCRACNRPFANADEIERERAEAESEIARRQGEMESLAHAGREAQKALDEYVEVTQQGVRALRDQLDSAQWRHAKASESLGYLSSAVEGHTAALARIESALATSQERAAEVARAERQLVTLEATATEMVRMKEHLIGTIIPTLEDKASAIVADLTDGEHTELHLTSDYEMQYRAGTGEWRSFHNLSGGAQRVFALALRLAIADVRAGKVPFLVLDEVFESLDDDRVDLAWSAVEHLATRYDQVFVVTHVAALRERAPNLVVLGA